MKAVILDKPTKSEDIFLSECPIPEVKSGWVLIKVMAFGLNHSEQILRRFEIEAPYIQKPIIPGIECAGEIADASDTNFIKGERVIAFMGGMGRSFNGSYAEYALLPAKNVFKVDIHFEDFSWESLAAIPETYFTAWGSLFESLKLQNSDKLLIRGGTCALGYASIQLAKELGCEIIATTHRENKLPILKSYGVDKAILDNGTLSKGISDITKALELVGPKTLKDTLQAMRYGGIVCNTGILGGIYSLNDFDPIKDIPNGVYLTGFFSNYPTQEIVNDILSYIKKYNLNPLIGKVFKFSEIAKACSEMDSGSINGKIIISVNE